MQSSSPEGSTQAGLSLQFLDAADPGFTLSAVMFQDELSALFSLSLTVQCENACVELTAVVGKRVALTLPSHSLLPRVTGITREARALTAETTGTSYYLLSVVPPLWLTTRRVNYRIFQDRSIKIEDSGITIKSSGPIKVNGSVIDLNC